MQKKISVIIPVYNSESLLSESLDSVVCQTIMKDIEIIIVNDGSTDSSMDIIRSYSERFDNIIVIDQENQGVSVARNNGLVRAVGKYIYFMDSDDLLEPNSLEMLYSAAEKVSADMVIAKYDIFNQFAKINVKNLDSITSQKYIYKYDPALLWSFSLWNKLFKKELIDKYQLRFPEDTSYSEDGVFVMSFIYKSKTITGLDSVVYHYRKYFADSGNSITTNISSKKLRDYIYSHKIILETAVNSLLANYPEYENIQEAVEKNNGINTYVNEFYRKEIQILFNQFYKKFWSLDEEMVAILAGEITRLTGKTNLYRYNQLLNAHSELPLKLYSSFSEAKNDFKVTAVVPTNGNTEDFIECLKSLCYQNFIPLKIVVPSCMKNIIEENKITRPNIFYIDKKDTSEFFHEAFTTVNTPYIIFCHNKIRYNTSAIAKMYRFLNRTHFDFVSNLIYMKKGDQLAPVSINKKAFTHLTRFCSYENDAEFDSIYANKMFKVAFLNKLEINFADSISDSIEKVYKYGYFKTETECRVIYTGKEIDFPSTMLKHTNNQYLINLINDEPITLNSPSILNHPEKVAQKLLLNPKKKTLKGIVAKLAMKFMRLLPVKNRVFFMSIRKDSVLEGNAAALEPYITGKKVIAAKTLPHGLFYKLKMYYYTFTSKVIVCDDYNRYLRIFPLKPQQRVIQLWHACGAFKKFGRHGTTLKKRVDLATHIQYNVVCVSSQAVRPIYADAFGIDIKHVKALGCARTDKFFDENYVSTTTDRIYAKYPYLKGKEIIIYAPTFRDKGSHSRTHFKPELDFKKLSGALLENQIFIICPHPVMKNNIVDKKYDNIKVIRDFSTNEMMLVSDLMITDYSSVIFEYALLKKPMAFFCYDLKKYDRGFYLSYKYDLPGELLKTDEELIDFLKSDKRLETDFKYEMFLEKYMSACDGKSCERIAKLINDYMGES